MQIINGSRLLATLKHLHDIAPRHPYVLKLIMQLYQEVKDWPQLISILPDLKKYHVVNQQEFDALQYNAYFHRLVDLIKQNHPDTVTNFIHSLPKT